MATTSSKLDLAAISACHNCRRTPAQVGVDSFKACAGCRALSFCGRACQVAGAWTLACAADRPAWAEHKPLCKRAGSGEDETLNGLYKRVHEQMVGMMGQIADELQLAGVCAHECVGEAADRLEEDCIVLQLEACNRAERRRNQAFRFVDAVAMSLDMARDVKPQWANTIDHFKRSLKDESMPPRSLVLVMATFQHREAGDSAPHVYAVYRSLIQELTQPAVDAATAIRPAARQRWRARLAEAVSTARVG